MASWPPLFELLLHAFPPRLEASEAARTRTHTWTRTRRTRVLVVASSTSVPRRTFALAFCVGCFLKKAPWSGRRPGADADGAADEEEPATPVQAVAKVPRRQKHSGASPLLVAAVPAPHNSPPPVPVFVARDPSLPPPERQPRAAPGPRYKRKAGVHRGSDVLATSERCAIQCPHACCVNGGFSDALATTWRQQLRDASAKGAAFRRAYLLALIGRQQHSGKPAGQFM